MNIDHTCPECGTSTSFPIALAARVAQCPECQAELRVPWPESLKREKPKATPPVRVVNQQSGFKLGVGIFFGMLWASIVLALVLFGAALLAVVFFAKPTGP